MGKVTRLTHKQIEAAIKRDELRDFFDEAGDWVKSHLENVLIGLVLAALLAFGAVYLAKSRHEDTIKASVQLASAEQQFARAEGSGDPSAYDAAKAGYEQVKAGFQGKDEAVAAELGLANLAFAQGKIDDARGAFEQFVANHGSSALAPLAQSGQAACLEASGKLKEAADAYLALGQKTPISAVTALSLFDAARCLQGAGDKARLKDAVAALDQLDSQKLLPESLKSRLQALKKRV